MQLNFHSFPLFKGRLAQVEGWDADKNFSACRCFLKAHTRMRTPNKNYNYRTRFNLNSPLISLSLLKYSAPSGPTATPAGRAQRSPFCD